MHPHTSGDGGSYAPDIGSSPVIWGSSSSQQWQWQRWRGHWLTARPAAAVAGLAAVIDGGGSRGPEVLCCVWACEMVALSCGVSMVPSSHSCNGAGGSLLLVCPMGAIEASAAGTPCGGRGAQWCRQVPWEQ